MQMVSLGSAFTYFSCQSLNNEQSDAQEPHGIIHY